MAPVRGEVSASAALGLMRPRGPLVSALPDDVHLMLVGPEVSGVSDDPEDAEVLAECRNRWRELGASRQERVHLTCLPIDDVDENAHLINALQRRP